jgi:predicted acetyltransferase
MLATVFTFDRVGPKSDAVLRNLYEHYVHDMSEWLGIDVRPDGAFGHDTSPLWEGEHAVFLARSGDALAGFGVVGSAGAWLDDPAVRDVKDFFVLRRYRHQGLGDALAAHLWGAFRGPWLVRVFTGNRPALSFWRRVVAAYTGGGYDERTVSNGRRDWIHLRFDSAAAGRS